MNRLYYGDNLEVLRDHIDDESVDLVYLDPPFNSNASYNVLFAEHDGTKAAAQIHAFDDTWRWDEASARAYQETVEAGGDVSRALQAFRTLVGESDMLAYLAMMAPRLVELHRVLKPTGSLYLHCDPTASHYLKLLLDAVFGPRRFVNEIVWQRTRSHNIRSSGFPRVNDTLLFFSRSETFTFNTQYEPYGPEQLSRYRRDDEGRLYKAENLTFSTPNPSRQFEWRGARPPGTRSWGASREQLEQWFAEGRILLKRDGVPRLDGLKVYLDEMPGKPVSTNWTDIPRVGNTASERLGYPTQKPEALLERIISTSSNEGDVVLDPFCGCGTAIAAAQKLGRRWIGIDITHLAIGLIKSRLRDTFGDAIATTYEVIGEPADLAGARQLAADDPWQFEAWALGLVGARQAKGKAAKKGADRGVDGRLYFHEGRGDTKQIVLSVKGGKLKADDIRSLGLVREREKAEIGVLISLNAPTAKMRADAASAGFYESPWGQHSRLQILTIEELLGGRGIDYPRVAANLTTRQARRVERAQGEQLEIE